MIAISGVVDATFTGWSETFRRADIPVDPSAPEARQWLNEELAKAPYQAAKPTWFDRLSQAFFDWVQSLTVPSGEGLGAWLPLIVAVIVAALVVTAFLIFGLPRLNRRSKPTSVLFGEDDHRSADMMRKSALASATTGEWGRASEEMFRAIARGLFERTIVQLAPGTTAHDVAAAAATAFPGHRTQLVEAAVTFDQVRYLGTEGTEYGYTSLADLESALRGERPILPDHSIAPDDHSQVVLS